MPKVPKARTTQRKDPLQGTRKPEPSSKANGSSEPPAKGHPPNYLFHTCLLDSEDPLITRVLSVPSTFTLEKMHAVMQIAFGWANCHVWQFELHRLYSSEEEEEEAYERNGNQALLTFMNDPEDMILAIPDRADTFKHAFEWKLSDIFDNDEYRSSVRLTYEYDMGDSWEHQITFLGVEDPGNRKVLMPDAEYNFPICLAGEGCPSLTPPSEGHPSLHSQGHPCAEDCGGAPGWEGLKEAFAKPRAGDPELKDWYKRVCFNGDRKGLDPYKWSIMDVNDQLCELKA